MIENVIFISTTENLHLVTNKYTRLYFGSEFCGNLLPSLNDINIVQEFCQVKNIDFSLVLPWCTENNTKSITNILEFIPSGTEIIFNDWGIWQLMEKTFKYKEFTYILGRILCDIKSDPRILFISDNMKREYTKQCALNSSFFQNFIAKKNINKAELSNTFQGYNFSLKNNISTSIYYPYVFTSITTFCIFKKLVNVETCDKNCINKHVVSKLPQDELNVKLYIRGNYEFYQNNKIPSKEKQSIWNVNRIVFMPELTY